LQAHLEGSRGPGDEPAGILLEPTSSPALRDLVADVARDGQAWAQARKAEFFEIFKSTRGRSSSVTELGDRYAAKERFSLSVTCLPVNGKRSWAIDREHSLISYQLYADQEGFLIWLEKAVSVAVGGH